MISEIVRKIRKYQGITQESFALAICEEIPGINLTKQAISNWERGSQTPDYMFLVSMTLAYKDWRFDFALECLRILRPAVWGDQIPSTLSD